jgi:phage-related protein
VAQGFQIAEGYLEVAADHSRADREMGKFFRSTDGKLRDARGRFAKQGEAAGVDFVKGLRRGMSRGLSGGRLLGGFRNLLRMAMPVGAAFGGLLLKGVAAALLAGVANTVAQFVGPFTAQLIGALGHIGGALGALAPAGILALATSMIALKIAFSGVGEALKAGWSGDAAAFAEATKDMGVATRVFLQDVISLKPALTDLKRIVQGNFFGPLLGVVKPLGMLYLPMIRDQLAFITHSFGTAAASFAGWLDTPAAFDLIANLLGNIGLAVENFAPALAQLAQTFLVIARVGSDFLPGFAERFAALVDRFSEFINLAARDGSLQQWITTGLGMLREMWNVLKDVFGIFQAIATASPGQSGLLGVVGSLLMMLNQFLNSASGQGLLRGIFEGLELLSSIAKRLLTDAGPGLVTFIQALVAGFQALLPAAGPVGQALGAIFTALAPLLPVLGHLATVILVALADILRIGAIALQPFIAFFSDLASQVLPMLLPVLGQLVNQALPVAVQMFGELSQIMAPLLPLFVELARTFIEQLLPVLPQLTAESEPLRVAILDLARQLVPLVIDLMPALMAEIPVLIQLFVAFVRVMGFIVSAAARVVNIITRAVAAYRAFLHAGAELLGNIRQLPSAIQNVFSSAGSWLVDAGRRIIQGLINGIHGMIGQLKNKLSSITNMLPDWKGPEQVDRRILRPSGRAVMAGFMGGIDDALPGLSRMLGNIAPSVAEGVGRSMPDLGQILGARTAAMAASAPQVNVAAPNVAVGGPSIRVFLDNREIAAAITLDPTAVNRASAEGGRRRSWTNTGRTGSV